MYCKDSTDLPPLIETETFSKGRNSFLAMYGALANNAGFLRFGLHIAMMMLVMSFRLCMETGSLDLLY